MPEFLYIHIPFCIRKCIYCDFLSIPYDEPLTKKYVDALCRELILKKNLIGTLKTIYVGGGTPSVLPGESFIHLFTCLKENFRFLPIEVTVEANPGAIDELKINALLYSGVNRVSLGVQSFNDNELKTLGRIHSADDAIRSVEIIKEAGIRNFSIDLIYGIPGQTLETWEETLSKAVSLSPTHISSYELTPEKGTPLYEMIKSKKIQMPDEDIVIDMYNYAIDYLASNGYEHYEISNFALPGFCCIHNLNYWDRGEYVGAGAGAHSFIRGFRSKNTDDINRYIEDLNNNIVPEIESTEIKCEDAIKEFIFLGLRKTEGISLKIAGELGLNIPDLCKELVDEGYLEIRGGYLRLTRKALVISNAIIVRLFEKLRLDYACRNSYPKNILDKISKI